MFFLLVIYLDLLFKVSECLHSKGYQQRPAHQYRSQQGAERECIHDDSLYRKPHSSVRRWKAWQFKVIGKVNGFRCYAR